MLIQNTYKNKDKSHSYRIFERVRRAQSSRGGIAGNTHNSDS